MVLAFDAIQLRWCTTCNSSRRRGTEKKQRTPGQASGSCTLSHCANNGLRGGSDNDKMPGKSLYTQVLCQPSQQSRPKIMPNLQQADAVHPLISRSLIKVRGIQLVPSEHLSLRMYVQPATFLTTSRERRSAGGPTAYHANSRVVC